MAERGPPDSPHRQFTLGTYVFTVGQAREAYLLHKQRVTVRQIQQLYHPNASLREIVAAIQIGIQGPDIRLDELCAAFFNVDIVVLEMWNVGYEVQTRAEARRSRAARPNEQQ